MQREEDGDDVALQLKEEKGIQRCYQDTKNPGEWKGREEMGCEARRGERRREREERMGENRTGGKAIGQG